MRNWNNGDNWDFARWLRNTSRNAKANIAVNTLPEEELALYRTVVNFFCNIEEETSSDSSASSSVGTGTYTVGGTRPWLYQRLLDKAISGETGYRFDAAVEPGYVIVRVLEVIARDLVAIPLSAEETEYLTGLDFMPVNDTEHAEGDPMHRAFGATPGFGGVAGSRGGKTVWPSSSSSSEESSESSEESSASSEESSSSSETVDERFTTFHFADSPDESYLIEGSLDQGKMAQLGFYNTDADTHYAWLKEPTSVEVGNSVTNVGEQVFRGCSSLSSITLPDTVSAIREYAFANCNNLTAITIPEAVNIIYRGAFDNCRNLTSVSLPIYLTTIGASAFFGCGVTEIVIGDSVTSIGDQAFRESKLVSITLGSSVESIGYQAFGGCPLTELSIPPSVQNLDVGAFANTSISEITMQYRTMNQVEAMANYAWGLNQGTAIICMDGTLEAPEGGAS